MLDKSEQLKNAIQYHQAGKLKEAEVIYERILEHDPNHADALHLLGFIAHQRRKNDLAVDLIRRAIKIHPDSAFYYNNLALALLELGRLEEAAVCCQTGLKLSPNMVQAHCNMGNTLKAQGKLTEAVSCYQRAIEIRPDYPTAYCSMGIALVEQGNLADAIVCYQKAIELSPNHVEAYSNLGIALRNDGKLSQALACFNKAIALSPRTAELYANAGIVLAEQDRLDEAVSFYCKAIEIRPDYVEALNNLAVTLRKQGALARAISCYKKAIELKPDMVKSYRNLFMIFHDQREFQEMVACYRKILDLDPDHSELHYAMGNAFRFEGKLVDAASCYQRAISTNPDCFDAYNDLGIISQTRGLLSRSITYFKKAIEINPDYAKAYNNLGNSHGLQFDFHKAILCYEKAIQLKPDYKRARSNSFFAALYDPAFDEKALFEKALECWKSQDDKKIGRHFHKKKSLSVERLRVGYVSPDFRKHSVSYFFPPLLKAHNRNAVEVFCYSEVEHPDRITEQIRQTSDNWRSTVGLSDESVADQIRKDRVDILVDLAGHSSNNRLTVFIYKPAPVQVTWLGYPATTGISAIDYRLTDSIADPEGNADACHTETLVRLPRGFLCYAPPEDAPHVSNTPVLNSDTVTFGSFNSPKKMNGLVFSVWSEILKQVPGSHLFLQSIVFSDEFTRQRCAELFLENGIPSERITMSGLVPSTRELMDLYGKVDIALDPFPYNGTTTTCEALWMGVPVVTLRGERHSGRVGASILTRIGLPELIAATENDYVAKAVALATDIEHLTDLRADMRNRMSNSSLCNAKTFAHDMEDAFRKMWEKYCGSDNSGNGSAQF